MALPLAYGHGARLTVVALVTMTFPVGADAVVGAVKGADLVAARDAAVPLHAIAPGGRAISFSRAIVRANFERFGIGALHATANRAPKACFANARPIFRIANAVARAK